MFEPVGRLDKRRNELIRGNVQAREVDRFDAIVSRACVVPWKVLSYQGERVFMDSRICATGRTVAHRVEIMRRTGGRGAVVLPR